ncbi:MAG: DUF6249 domain-containing protein [Spirosomataceae bacterium]
MRKIIMSFLGCLIPIASAFAQNQSITTQSDVNEPLLSESKTEIIMPILFISFLIVMLISLVKYFLDFRLKNKLIDRGMSEQLSAYLSNKNDQEKKDEVIKLAILFCGIGLGLLITYFSAPIDIHSLAIMSFSLGISYLAYFFYLRK